MYSRGTITRHSLLSLSFVLLYLLLNRPEVVLFSNIGFVAWYPAIGLVMALMLGISPWYAVLAFFTNAFTNTVLYAQPVCRSPIRLVQRESHPVMARRHTGYAGL
jgi:hypothetical protein